MKRENEADLNPEIQDILRRVQKPGRYVGGEWNQIKKNPREVDFKVALAFPDVYEVGMSHLGQKILYHILNRIPGVAAERVYAPWPDFEKQLREKDIFLYSLENQLPLHCFDIIGFSFLYELNAVNILTMLERGGIPLLSRERKKEHPLIIAGGPAAFNPEPVSDFFDAVALGDGEKIFPEIIEIIKKNAPEGRKEKLRKLQSLPGVYIPSFYSPYKPQNSPLLSVRPHDKAPDKISKQIIESLNINMFPQDIIVPNIRTIFNRISVEAGRGCPQNCRFCQARQIYFPSRWKNPDDVAETVFRSVPSTGYEDASLTALSIGDYPGLPALMENLMEELEPEKVSLSLSALRPGMLTSRITENILRVRKTGITLVPEAGTERLRKVINKNITEEEILRAAENAFSSGWRKIKLYFMVGLPTETRNDILGIVDTVKNIIRTGYRILKKSPQINLSISSFIPKPHTPFQWDRMDSEKDLIEKHRFIKSRLKKYRFVQFKEQSIKSSILEAVFSRGDRKLNSVLLEAWKKGARFDSWSDCFDFSIYRGVFKRQGIEINDYLDSLDKGTVLPWDHIDTGIKKSYLLKEWECSRQAEKTENCRNRICAKCRGCSYPAIEKKSAGSLKPRKPQWFHLGKEDKEAIHRYRVRYQKTGKARYFSHMDVSIILQRGLRRAGIKPLYSYGFHPKMQISFPPALPLGMAGKDEVFEFRSHHRLPDNMSERADSFFPEGVRLLSFHRIPFDSPSLTKSITELVYSMDLTPESVQAAVENKAGGNYSGMMEIIRNFHRENYTDSLKDIRVNSRRKRLLLIYGYHPGAAIRPQSVWEDVFSLEYSSFYLTRDEVRLKKFPNNPIQT